MSLVNKRYFPMHVGRYITLGISLLQHVPKKSITSLEVGKGEEEKGNNINEQTSMQPPKRLTHGPKSLLPTTGYSLSTEDGVNLEACLV
mmetsp:Transcript_25811/g.65177  ORF Transcript_25811/g.65177 Transcript_25811/m.65177 type:complete len:89 (-) Transcript_25811:911-1177(-)